MRTRIARYLFGLAVVIMVAFSIHSGYSRLFADEDSAPFDAQNDELFGSAEDPLGDENTQVEDTVAVDDDTEEVDTEEIVHFQPTPAGSIDNRNTATLQRLRRKADFYFSEVALQEMLDQVFEVADIQFLIDDSALDRVPLDISTMTTSSQLRDVPLETFLYLMLNRFELAFTIHDGVVVITTQNDVEYHPVTQVFSVQPLIHPDSEVASAQRLIDVITTSVAPDSWERNGGFGTIINYQGSLVVTNTPMVLRLTEDLLLQLQHHVAETGGPKKEVITQRTPKQVSRASKELRNN